MIEPADRTDAVDAADLDPREAVVLDYLDALAGADGRTCANESEVLDRLARYLGSTSHRTRKYRRRLRTVLDRRPHSAQGRLDLFEMLARVAWSDGSLLPVEERFLAVVARRFELEPASVARILAEEEHRFDHHRRLRRQGLYAGLLLALTIAGVTVVLAVRDRDPDLASFRAFESRYERSVLLLHVVYDVVGASGMRTRHSSTGSGFFVSADGDAVTNKHVLQPWKFPGTAWEALAAGGRIDSSSYDVLAWPAGTEVFRSEAAGRRSLQRDNAFRLADQSLQVFELPGDRWIGLPAPGNVCALGAHADSNDDLAVFHCAVGTAVVPLPLAADTSAVAALDSVLVIGFPRGLHPLELAVARCSPVIGWVRKGEETIQISAPIHPGNSGGPLVDVHGQVTGIATRTSAGDATMGQCIRAEHVRTLLERARRQRTVLDRLVLTAAPPVVH